MATNPNYPATSLAQGTSLVISDSNLLHEIVNGTDTEEIIVDDGPIPSLRKALKDNFYFKNPIDWVQGNAVTEFNQLVKFTDGTLWVAPTARATNPILMGVTPVGDTLWEVSYVHNALSQVARSLNVTDDQVIYATDTSTVLDNKIYIYDASTQVTLGVPSGVGAGEVIVSVSGSDLVTSGGSYMLTDTALKSFGSVANLKSNTLGVRFFAGMIVSTGATTWKVNGPVASNYGWIDLGSGLSAFPQSNIFVTDFGTKGTGLDVDAENDTLAIKEALSLINKENNFRNTMAWPSQNTERGIGDLPTLELNGTDVYSINDTLQMSTNFTLKGNGAGFKATTGLEDKNMLEVRYNLFGNGVESYGTMFNSISNIRIDGNGIAQCGLFLDRANWSVFSHIYISSCVGNTAGNMGYGIKLEECQYTTFTNVYSSGNKNGWHVGNASNAGLRCVDLQFYGCSANSNEIGMHISNLGQGNFYGVDLSRNTYADVLLNEDNGDGTISNAITRNVAFYDMKSEHINDGAGNSDVPSSGACIYIPTGPGEFNNISFIRPEFAMQGVAEYFWIINENGRYISIVEPMLPGQSYPSLPNVNNPGVQLPLYKSSYFGGVIVTEFTNAIDADIFRSLAVDENDVIIGGGSDKVAFHTLTYDSVSQKKRRSPELYADLWQNVSNASKPEFGISFRGVTFGPDLINEKTASLKHSAGGDEIKLTCSAPDLHSAFALNGEWNTEKLRIRAQYFWVDESDNIRTKKFAPSSATDGVIVQPAVTASGSFTSNDGKTITVEDGSITSIV